MRTYKRNSVGAVSIWYSIHVVVEGKARLLALIIRSESAPQFASQPVIATFSSFSTFFLVLLLKFMHILAEAFQILSALLPKGSKIVEFAIQYPISSFCAEDAQEDMHVRVSRRQ